ncbi:MAG: hypothetical protein RL131_771 [Bacteroidota bacterium]
MAIVNIIMPKLGESIMEATVLKWHKKIGDFVKLDETLLDIATDKVDSEVPSSAEGILEEILYKENEVVPIGAVFARIKTSTPDPQPENISPAPPAYISQSTNGKHIEEKKSESIAENVPYQPVENVQKSTGNSKVVRFYSPLVMNIATSEGIPLSELEQITGTGNEGRVTKQDVLNYLENKKHRPSSSIKSNTENLEPRDTQPPTSRFYSTADSSAQGASTEVIEMDRMRRLIADHMIKSKEISAHVTSFAEADVTHLVKWREKNKSVFEKREGEKITLTPLFLEAIVKSLKKFPLLNSSVDGYNILVKKDIHLGMATALPNGNLIVPVIKFADQFSLIGLTKQVNRLAQAARNGKLTPGDTQDGTFTFTNIGTFGSLMGTPLINQPQVAILATGAIQKKPVVVESEKGDSIGIRHMMFVSMSYDHRIIDGAMGSAFLSDFVKNLESFDLNREI